MSPPLRRRFLGGCCSANLSCVVSRIGTLARDLTRPDCMLEHMVVKRMKPCAYQTILAWSASFVCGAASCGMLLYAITRPYPAEETSAGVNFVSNLVFLPLVAGSWLLAYLAARALRSVYRLTHDARVRLRIVLLAPLIVLIAPTVVQVLAIGGMLLYVYILLLVHQVRIAIGI
jgi:hypothetical protein